ncbi:mammalian cell entry protein [Mycobacterium sp.]|uniref:mammalian cell entry protein n=1 Tax=Mycobacterium sp. TaxID=1785 RepID=UPI001270CC72|nr:mammalian cell entry protein [Mycobacterium sp.]KAA8967495.1 MAG: mammalian cell entry protein [Mycobacterium sp.]
MEDQQPGAGVLSEKVTEDQPEDTAAADPGADEPGAAEDTPSTESDGAQPVRRPAGKWLAVTVGIAAALFVGSAAFAGAAVQPYLVDQAVVHTKLNIARTAANAITTLWTYTPDNIDKLADRASQYLGGDFGADYRKYIDKIVAPSKQAQITNTTQVIGAAVESLNGPNAVALVYTNTTATSPLTKNIPSLKYFSYRLTMKRDRARWLVTKMSTVTALDLTPQF